MITSNRLSSEITGNRFGDPRLTRRLRSVLDSLAERPNLGLPRAMASEAALEGVYRFLKNPKVDPQRILGPHIEATCERAQKEGLSLVIHDTTVLKFNHRDGLGVISRESVRGFYAHFALAVGFQSGEVKIINFVFLVMYFSSFSGRSKMISKGKLTMVAPPKKDHPP